MDSLIDQTEALTRWGVDAIEFRLDLVPESLWREVVSIRSIGVPWWLAHFGTGSEEPAAREVVGLAVESAASGAIFHSRCAAVEEFAALCRSAGKRFAAPFHSQSPLTMSQAVEEFRHQQSLDPEFRKIAVRATSYEDAAALLEATRLASSDGGSAVVSAIFGPHRWARLALPFAGSAITFLVAERVVNEQGGDDQQLQIAEVDALLQLGGLLHPAFAEHRQPVAQTRLVSAS